MDPASPRSAPARDLFEATLAWSRPWWDAEAAMLVNPPRSFSPDDAGRTLHLTQSTPWFAHGLLQTGDEADARDAVRTIDAVLALQYDRPGTEVHGTFRRFLEWPADPPAAPVMWEDYDPNWRQFVGTALALIVEDFGARLDPELVGRMLDAIELAARGEPDGRIPTEYTNPALMRAWLDAWVGRHRSSVELFDRGEAFARRIVERFDLHGAFEEFNSPTYYATDLFALALWRALPPSGYFAEHGERIERSLWSSLLDFFHPNLRNWCGPYTRSYHPDATRSVAKSALWLWAMFGRDAAALPSLDDDAAEHRHDLFVGPVVSRLVAPVAGVDAHALAGCRSERRLEVTLPGDRRVTASIGPTLMIGAESSTHDWGGWDQFFPLVAHWAGATGTEILWLVEPRCVDAHVTGSTCRVAVDTPEIVLLAQAATCRAGGGRLHVGTTQIDVTAPDGRQVAMRVDDAGEGRFRITLGAPSIALRFSPP